MVDETQSKSPSGATCENPVFIVGAPRSGTTLMRQILDAHPSILCPPWETGFFLHVGAMMAGDLPSVMGNAENRFPLTRTQLTDWLRESCDSLFARFSEIADKPRWAEKTPGHVHHMDLIATVFPGAQFIHMLRNGYDVVRSLKHTTWAPRSSAWRISTWIESVDAGRRCGEALGTQQYIELRYEELIESPEEQVRRLCGFLNEEFTPAMLQFHKPDHNSWNAEVAPLQSKPLNKTRPLGFCEKTLVQWRAGRLMRSLGYR